VSFHEGTGGRSRRFYGLPTRAKPRQREDARPERSSREGGRGGRRQKDRDRGVKGSVAHGSVGRQRPRCCTRSGKRKGAQSSVVRRPAEAVSGVVKTPGPPVIHCAEPKTPRGVHASQGAHGAGNERGAGARDSIGWQKSVRRIVRLPCRSIARSVGSPRALAGRKFVAPPDAERGWIKGETVRLVRGNPQDSTESRHAGFGLHARTRRKAFLGFCPAGPHRLRRSRVLRLPGQCAQCLARKGQRRRRSASGGRGIRPGRASE
jgi:hypothetical protein